MIRIFLIDDDSIYLMLARKIINTADARFDITEFTLAENAIKYLTENRQQAELLPDIIFVDLSMPVMDGWSFIEQFQQLTADMSKSISLYIVTSSMAFEDVERSKKYDIIEDYLIKPLEREKIKEIADSIAQSPHGC
ncbi:MAG TPA: response regulator [Puia sp.]